MARPLLEALRDATRAAHAAVEHVPALARLLAPDLTRVEYAATLGRMYRFHLALEPRLRSALAGVADLAAFAEGGRAGAIAVDLHALGVAAPRPAPLRALPRLDTPAAAMGCLYVMEGSALGGRVIAKRLADSVGVTPRDGARFFGGESADVVRDRWLAFCAALEATGRALSASEQRRLLIGATACFTRLGAWMAAGDKPADLAHAVPAPLRVPNAVAS
jgi:heme oxygenase